MPNYDIDQLPRQLAKSSVCPRTKFNFFSSISEPYSTKPWVKTGSPTLSQTVHPATLLFLLTVQSSFACNKVLPYYALQCCGASPFLTGFGSRSFFFTGSRSFFFTGSRSGSGSTTLALRQDPFDPLPHSPKPHP